MPLNASFFNNKKNLSISQQRVELIMSYVIHCYLIVQKKSPKYSKSQTEKAFEEYLRDRLVDDYLRINLGDYSNRFEDFTISFTKEPVEQYKGSKGGKDDKIDICVTIGELKDILNTPYHSYFAIECKRVKNTDDYSAYIKDIGKFVVREYEKPRMSIEGQIAFIENSDLTHEIVSDGVNIKLEKSKTITTTQKLVSTSLHPSFNGSYHSKHKRNHGKKQVFTIYHLMFDYSSIVTA